MNKTKIIIKFLITITIFIFTVCVTSISVSNFKYTSLVIAPEKILSTGVLQKNVDNTVVIPDVVVEKKDVTIPKNTPTSKPVPTNKPVVTPTPNPVLENIFGTLSGYGPDCTGCTSNKTASGYYIGEGNIYYQDSTYGLVRIVSGDKKYPFGTVVRIKDTGYFNDDVIAIVLDRGGGVGIGKSVQFDLLFPSENDTRSFGLKKNVNFEIIRLGY